MNIVIFLVLLGGMVFFTQRQQKKAYQQRQQQLNQLKKGDEVITIGGLIAVIDEIDTTANRVVLDVEGVYLPFELSAIKQVLPSSETQGAIETVSEAVDQAISEE